MSSYCTYIVTFANDCARTRRDLLFIGQVELENLPLKKDALKNLELAVEVKHGIWFRNFCFINISVLFIFVYFLH